MSSSLDSLRERLADVVSLTQIAALVEWDQQCYAPEAAADSKARHLTVLNRLSHEMLISDETGRLLEAAEQALNGAAYDSFEASLLRVTRRQYERARKLPSAFVSELSKATAQGFDVWVRARANNDFPAFVPALERIIDLKRQEADYRGYTGHPYDALLDVYEHGMTAADIDAMFADLRTDLVPLVAAIRERSDSVDDACLHQPFDEQQQQAFSEMVVAAFGYDFTRGRQDRAVHPFCTNFSLNDVRITTRFDPNWLNPAMFGTFHEAGHAMYEQGSAPTLEGTPLAGGTSLGVHESQSRLWENVVGRSRAFWQHYYPLLQKTFPAQLGSVALDTFYRAINKVQPTFIRVEADEAHYNLHIMMRFEIEKDLLDGSLKVKDLPEVWNAKFRTYMGVTPPDDAQGVLQDIHWSNGLVGYFPTYSIGNLLSVQLYDRAVDTHPGIPDEIARGEFGTLLGWLRDKIHVHGSKFEPKEIIHTATGEPLQSGAYVRYLKRKYSEIYNL